MWLVGCCLRLFFLVKLACRCLSSDTHALSLILAHFELVSILYLTTHSDRTTQLDNINFLTRLLPNYYQIEYMMSSTAQA
jgi:hypothetical protein